METNLMIVILVVWLTCLLFVCALGCGYACVYEGTLGTFDLGKTLEVLRETRTRTRRRTTTKPRTKKWRRSFVDEEEGKAADDGLIETSFVVIPVPEDLEAVSYTHLRAHET